MKSKVTLKQMPLQLGAVGASPVLAAQEAESGGS